MQEYREIQCPFILNRQLFGGLKTTLHILIKTQVSINWSAQGRQ